MYVRVAVAVEKLAAGARVIPPLGTFLLCGRGETALHACLSSKGAPPRRAGLVFSCVVVYRAAPLIRITSLPLKEMAKAPAFRGEETCEQCPGKAYYTREEGGLFCGRHCPKEARVPLPRSPALAQKKASEEKRRARDIECARKAHSRRGERGEVALARARMMRRPEKLEGFVAVFPNYRAGDRRSGTIFNASELSPMKLGPVKHGQPDLPPARLLENFHQANKVFPSEVSAKGKILPVWYRRRLELYKDKTPHRHKLGKTKAEHLRNAAREGETAPLYSIFVEPDGKEQRLSYLQSRRPYCRFYSALARRTEAFKELKRMLGEGYNLEIFDPDGRPMREAESYDETKRLLAKEYRALSRPFGHGKVLFCLLVLRPADRPWVKR